MSRGHVEPGSGSDRRAARLGLLGAAAGAGVGFVELTVGATIRSWIGGKNDPTRLGIVTVLLAALALGAAMHLARQHDRIGGSWRAAITSGMLVPALVGLTTAGRLWFLPGALLFVAAALCARGLRGEARTIARDLDRHLPAVFAGAVAVLYIALGFTALGVPGWCGIAGGVFVLVLLVTRPEWPRYLSVGALGAAVIPFAALTWWSVVTPLAAVLIVGFGAAVLTPEAHVQMRFEKPASNA